MKFALLLTQNCNLACEYCYITKERITMSPATLKEGMDFMYAHSMEDEHVDIGFFGGEPLLEFSLLKQATRMIEEHPEFKRRKIELQVTTNGTIYSDEIADFLIEHSIGLGISCDGNRLVHDLKRKYSDGRPSSYQVEKNILKALERFPGLMVNAVYSKDTYRDLPVSLDYFYRLGLRRIFINPDFGDAWSIEDVASIGNIYDQIGRRFCEWHERNNPAFISLITGKIIVIMNKGYRVDEQCQMGRKEFAIAPNGNVFPCERLVGNGSPNGHCLGNISTGIDYAGFCQGIHFTRSMNPACRECSLRIYCMNWCGCSNYFSTGYYDQSGPFICASEKASIHSAFEAFRRLEALYGASVIEKIMGNECHKQATYDECPG